MSLSSTAIILFASLIAGTPAAPATSAAVGGATSLDVGSFTTDAADELEGGFWVDVDTGAAWVAVQGLEPWSSWYDWQWRNDSRARNRWDLAVDGMSYVDGRVEWVDSEGRRTVCAELSRRVRRGRAVAVPTGRCRVLASSAPVTVPGRAPQQRVTVRLAIGD